MSDYSDAGPFEQYETAAPVTFDMPAIEGTVDLGGGGGNSWVIVGSPLADASPSPQSKDINMATDNLFGVSGAMESVFSFLGGIGSSAMDTYKSSDASTRGIIGSALASGIGGYMQGKQNEKTLNKQAELRMAEIKMQQDERAKYSGVPTIEDIRKQGYATKTRKDFGV